MHTGNLAETAQGDCRSVARIDRLISDVSGRAAADTRPSEGITYCAALQLGSYVKASFVCGPCPYTSERECERTTTRTRQKLFVGYV